jgi:23S rRNA pseudouridine2605 synthase
VSLARALSKLGVTSRSQAREWIEAGRVSVNGRVVRDPERRIDLDVARLAVDGAPVAASARVYLAFHKPKGVVTTRSDEHGRQTVYDVLAQSTVEEADARWVTPVGRLDRDSSGLLLLTNDTQWGAGISDPRSAVTKTYHVRVQPRITPEHLAQLSAPVSEDFGPPAAVSVVRESPRGTWLEITLTEGKNREIRRMCARLGYRVETLVRIQIGPIALGDLKPGEVRQVTPKEVAALRGRDRKMR